MKRPDVTIENHWGRWLLRPESARGCAWLEAEAAAKGWRMRGGAVMIDDGAVIPRVVAAMCEAGLQVAEAPRYHAEQAR